MGTYNKKALNIAGAIAGLAILLGIGGWWFIHASYLLNLSFIILGLDSIYFSKDLAMERKVKYEVNYAFARWAYVFVGTAFIIVSILLFLNVLTPR
jgi:hypothetical protein